MVKQGVVPDELSDDEPSPSVKKAAEKAVCRNEPVTKAAEEAARILEEKSASQAAEAPKR